MKKPTGKLFIISGTSQVGKSTIARALTKYKKLNLHKIITATTRPQRPEDRLATYHFILKSHFKKMIKQKKFLEWARVHKYYYGTPKQPVINYLKRGDNVALVIDVQGARQIKKTIPNTTTIFITAESRSELKRRIFESPHIPNSQKNARWHSTLKELKVSKSYDHIVINRWGRLNKAVNDVKKIIFKYAI